MAAQYPESPILLVDDVAVVLKRYDAALRTSGITNLMACQDSRDVLPLIDKAAFELCILDLNMPYIRGEELLKEIKAGNPAIPVIVVTATDEVETAVQCMKAGAFDYLVKPVEKNRLVSCVRKAIKIRELQCENRLLKERMLSGITQVPEAFSEIITQNKTMRSLFQYAEAISPSRQPILITGETGSGKELMVKALHHLTYHDRPDDRPLVSINVAGVDDQTFSDTLFGHDKGAFTGAEKRRPGLVEKASGGTLHLDEIGDLNAESQVKLLRLLEEGEYYPLGSDTHRTADTRIILSTNQDLESLQKAGRFRRDLYFRLCTHEIRIPPLRSRLDDIPLLLDHFTSQACRILKRKPPAYAPNLIQSLTHYTFPGNVRELKNMVFDAVSRCTADMLVTEYFKGVTPRASLSGDTDDCPDTAIDAPWSQILKCVDLIPIEEVIGLVINEAMERFGRNQSRAAQALGISRQRLARHLKRK